MKFHETNISHPPMILAIHGFTGEPFDFESTYEHFGIQNVHWRFVSLPGHHRDVLPKDINTDWKQFVGKIDSIVQEARESRLSLHVVAYSMGSRLFMRALLENRDWEISSLVLIGFTGGIEDPNERLLRAASDKVWAVIARGQGIDAFIDKWMQQPIIATQSKHLSKLRLCRKKRLQAESLADAMMQYSNGLLAPIWDKLGTIEIKTLLLAGQKDLKFQENHLRASQLMPNASTEIIPNAGHAPHLEQPASFNRLLENWIRCPGKP